MYRLGPTPSPPPGTQIMKSTVRKPSASQKILFLGYKHSFQPTCLPCEFYIVQVLVIAIQFGKKQISGFSDFHDFRLYLVVRS